MKYTLKEGSPTLRSMWVLDLPEDAGLIVKVQVAAIQVGKCFEALNLVVKKSVNSVVGSKMMVVKGGKQQQICHKTTIKKQRPLKKLTLELPFPFLPPVNCFPSS